MPVIWLQACQSLCSSAKVTKSWNHLGANATGRGHEIDALSCFGSFQKMCLDTPMERDSTKTAYYNPVFCAFGVQQAVENAKLHDSCLVVAPLRFAPFMFDLGCQLILKSNSFRARF